MANSTTGLRLSDETKQRLEKLGKSRDRSPHYLMSKAIENFLVHEEAIEAERQLLIERWEQFALTDEAVDHEEVLNWLDDIETNTTQETS